MKIWQIFFQNKSYSEIQRSTQGVVRVWHALQHTACPPKVSLASNHKRCAQKVSGSTNSQKGPACLNARNFFLGFLKITLRKNKGFRAFFKGLFCSKSKLFILHGVHSRRMTGITKTSWDQNFISLMKRLVHHEFQRCQIRTTIK